jgi:Rrf2 family transcriptional regulator, cysteine metabolism repressor
VKLSAKTEYGCLAMLHLAEHYPLNEPVQIRKVAADHGIPWRFLVQILLELKRGGLVSSTRGASGGYQLAREPEDISLAEVIAVLEGCDGAAEDNPLDGLRSALYAACREAQAAEQERLAGISLADLLEYAGGRREPMWYI